MTVQAQGEYDALQVEVEAQVQAEEVDLEGAYLVHLGNRRFYVVCLEDALTPWPTDQ